jgi:hypothetical protein
MSFKYYKSIVSPDNVLTKTNNMTKAMIDDGKRFAKEEAPYGRRKKARSERIVGSIKIKKKSPSNWDLTSKNYNQKYYGSRYDYKSSSVPENRNKYQWNNKAMRRAINVNRKRGLDL